MYKICNDYINLKYVRKISKNQIGCNPPFVSNNNTIFIWYDGIDKCDIHTFESEELRDNEFTKLLNSIDASSVGGSPIDPSDPDSPNDPSIEPVPPIDPPPPIID